MKLCIVTYQYSPTGKGGIANISKHLYDGLKKHHNVTLICNKDHSEGIRIFDDYKKIKGATYRNALRILRYRSSYDWVIATEEIAAFAAYFLAKGTKSKLAIVGHGTAITQMRDKPYTKMLFNQVLRRTNLFIANSAFTLRRLREVCNRPPKHEIIINPGVDTKMFNTKLEKKDDDFIVFTSGALVKGRRQELFFEVMPELIKHIPNLVYVLAGDGKKREEMEKRVKELKLENNVIFLGHISHDIQDYYEACDVYLALDDNDPIVGPESFGINIVEAMASGKPTIIIDNGGGNKEVVIDGKTGYICKDIDEVKDKVKYLYNNPSVMKEMGKNAKRESKRYDWKNILKQYEEALNGN
jgi:glycosyltransferase involved in cell wall biosynthesis